jgi:hypothetical protein
MFNNRLMPDQKVCEVWDVVAGESLRKSVFQVLKALALGEPGDSRTGLLNREIDLG